MMDGSIKNHFSPFNFNPRQYSKKVVGALQDG